MSNIYTNYFQILIKMPNAMIFLEKRRKTFNLIDSRNPSNWANFFTFFGQFFANGDHIRTLSSANL